MYTRPRKTRWKYKNTILLFLSVVVFFFIAGSTLVHRFIELLESFGYVGAFITGIFFVSTFTVAPAIVVLYNFALDFNPFLLALFAGAGAMLGDYLIFSFLKDRVYEEIRPLFVRFRGSYMERIFETPYFAWFLPVLGALIIASPFPDEIGIGLLGASKMKRRNFFILSFFLNTAGIFLIVTMSAVLQ